MSDQTQQSGAAQKDGTTAPPTVEHARPRPSIERPGQTDAPAGTDQSHTIVVLARDRHGALDRIIGVLRRRRARMQGFAIGRNEFPGMARITIVMNDSEVAVEHLVEQLRKIVDVQHVENLTSEQTVARELALIKVNSNK